MLIAHITDSHIGRPGERLYGVVDTASCLAAAVRHIVGLAPQPDAVVVTGDLVNRGRAEEYEHLLELLAPLRMPLYVVAGNHDSRDGLRRAFGRLGYLPADGFLNYAVEDHAVRLVGLDTLVPGSDGGALCAERLDWLDRALAAAPHRPTVVLMHHPPFATGLGFMDTIGLAGADGLAAVLARHPQVERVLCGHVHRPVQARLGGALVMAGPSTAHQIVLDLREGPPLAMAMEPAGIHVHMWRPGAPMVSHLALVGDYPEVPRGK